MPKSPFDKLYQTLPAIDRENDFFSFWNQAISDVKAISMKSEITKKSKNKNFTISNVKFVSHERSFSTGELHIPFEIDKPKVIIHIGDYNNKTDFKPYFTTEFAHFVVKLKGESSFQKNNNDETPSYFNDNILDINSYYPKSIYIDLYRAIDVLRLNKDLNCDSITINAMGFGCAAAIFAAAHSHRIKTLILNSPSFAYLPESQNRSSNDITNEINNYIAKTKGKKPKIKKNLKYFDSINFSDKIKCRTLMIVGFKDNLSPAKCSFALFNNLLVEKTMHAYPEEGFNPGAKKQPKESLNWLLEKI